MVRKLSGNLIPAGIGWIIILLVILCTCSGKVTNEFTIRGVFSGSEGEKILLAEMDTRQVIPLDSATINDKGVFEFTRPASEPGFFLLIFPRGNRLILLMEPGEHAVLTGNPAKGMTDINILGSKGSELLAAFFRVTARNRSRVDSVKAVLTRHEGADDFLAISLRADSVFREVQNTQKELEKDFIDRNPGSLASLIILNYSFGPEPVQTMKDDFLYYQKLEGLSKLYPANKHVIFHLNRLRLYLDEQQKQKEQML